MSFNDKSIYQLDNYHQMGTSFSLNFNDDAIFNINDVLNVNGTDGLNINDQSKVYVYGKLLIPAGSTIEFAGNGSILVTGSIISQGDSVNNVAINSDPYGTRLIFFNGDSLFIDYTTFNSAGITIQHYQEEEPLKYCVVENSMFINAVSAISFFAGDYSFATVPRISDCAIIYTSDVNSELAIYLKKVPEIILENNSINFYSSSEDGTGINLDANGIVDILACEITGGEYGIYSYSGPHPVNNVWESDISITGCNISSRTGIQFDVNTQYTPISSLIISDNEFTQSKHGIVINRFFDYTPDIESNKLSGLSNGSSKAGILLTNGSEVIVKGNEIDDFEIGINLNTINTPRIIENVINAQGVNLPQPGILTVSSDGEIRKNNIQYHLYGIEFGGSSPNVAENLITNNLYNGFYISNGSYPNLGLTINGPDKYPLTGYNIIRENGECNSDNSEIFFYETGADFTFGCNTIADDRGNGQGCDYTLLMDGIGAEEILATDNYWGDHPVFGHDPSGRFGEELYVEFDPYLEEPCIFSGGEESLILTTTAGLIIDTVLSSGSAPSELSDLQTRYKTAYEYFIDHSFTAAKQGYEGIIQNYGDSSVSLRAYNRLFTIANLSNSPPETFTQLESFYIDKASNLTDSLMIGALTHLADLCLVSATEYISAINNFDEQAQENPNTDVALYRQIDALTTALLLPLDSALSKGMLGKYSVKDISDYTNKLSELIKSRGKSGIESGEKLLPTEFTLYQNYPNPFNPTTTIKYDLPNASDVSLEIYDILGRRVKELVNTKQPAGRYEIQFNASNFASGVYIYQLIADKYISSKKMILLK